MDVRKLLDTIAKGIDFAENLAPVIAMIPGAGPIIATATKAIGVVAEVAQNIESLVKQGTVVMNSTDQEELQGYIARIEAANNELMDYVNNS